MFWIGVTVHFLSKKQGGLFYIFGGVLRQLPHGPCQGRQESAYKYFETTRETCRSANSGSPPNVKAGRVSNRPGASRLVVHHPTDDALSGLILLLGQGPLGGQAGLLLVCHHYGNNVYIIIAIHMLWFSHLNTWGRTYQARVPPRRRRSARSPGRTGPPPPPAGAGREPPSSWPIFWPISFPSSSPSSFASWASPFLFSASSSSPFFSSASLFHHLKLRRRMKNWKTRMRRNFFFFSF